MSPTSRTALVGLQLELSARLALNESMLWFSCGLTRPNQVWAPVLLLSFCLEGQHGFTDHPVRRSPSLILASTHLKSRFRIWC